MDQLAYFSGMKAFAFHDCHNRSRCHPIDLLLHFDCGRDRPVEQSKSMSSKSSILIRAGALMQHQDRTALPHGRTFRESMCTTHREMRDHASLGSFCMDS